MLEWLEWWLVNTIGRPVFALVSLHSAIEDIFVIVSASSVVHTIVSTMNASLSMTTSSGSMRTLICFARMVRLARSVEFWFAHALLNCIYVVHRCRVFVAPADLLIIGSIVISTLIHILPLNGNLATLLHVLGHLLAPDHLPKTLIQLLLEKDLRLGSANKNLSDKLRVVHDALIALVDYCSIRLLLSLSAVAPAILHVATTLDVLSARKVSIFTVEPLVLERDSLGGEPSDAFVLLSAYGLDCTAVSIGAGWGIRAEESSISALSFVASLAGATLHVVAELLFKH